MKNKYFNFISVLFIICCLSISFSSCGSDSDDEDNDGENLVSTELTINGTKIKVFSDLSGIVYRVPNQTGTKSLTATVFIDEANSTYFSVQFLNLDLGSINVGDNLANLKSYEATLYYKKEMYLLNNLFVDNKTKFEQYKGQVLVKEYDTSNQIMTLEFKNIILPLNKSMYPDYNSLMKVNGYIKCKIEMN